MQHESGWGDNVAQDWKTPSASAAAGGVAGYATGSAFPLSLFKDLHIDKVIDAATTAAQASATIAIVFTVMIVCLVAFIIAALGAAAAGSDRVPIWAPAGFGSVFIACLVYLAFGVPVVQVRINFPEQSDSFVIAHGLSPYIQDMHGNKYDVLSAKNPTESCRQGEFVQLGLEVTALETAYKNLKDNYDIDENKLRNVRENQPNFCFSETALQNICKPGRVWSQLQPCQHILHPPSDNATPSLEQAHF